MILVSSEERAVEGGEGTYLTVTSLIEREQVVLFRQTRERGVPHRAVGHERVDKYEPWRALVVRPNRSLHVELDALCDLDEMLLLLRLGKRKTVGAHFAHVQRD